MADIVASDVAVTVMNRRIEGVAGDKQVVIAKLVFGNGTLTYDQTGGIPLPAFTSFGMYKGVDYFEVIDLGASAYWWNIGYGTTAIRGYIANGTTGLREQIADNSTPVAQTIYVRAVGW